MTRRTRTVTTPFSDAVPPISTAERDDLKRRLKADGGAFNPVWLTEDNEVLDGHSRLSILGADACDFLTIPGSGEWSEAQKRAFVISCNRGQRNLSPAQDKELEKDSKRLAKELKAEGKTQSDIAKMFGVTQQRVQQWLATKKKGVSNTSPPCNANTPQMDVRVKIPPAAFSDIVERVEAGESQAVVAADYKVGRPRINQIYTKETKARKAKAEREDTVASLGDKALNVHHGDFRKLGSVVEDNSVDLIFTDPPYDEESVYLYGDLAKIAARILRPGGWCLAYSGQTFLPQVLDAMWTHLTYGWCFGIGHTGGDLRYRKLKLQNKWKPVVGFYKPPLSVSWSWFADFTSGGKEKDQHEWQQAEAEASHFIKALTPKGGVVCDPMCGGGTSLVAAQSLGMQWIGCDVDVEAIDKTKVRLIKGRAT